MLQIKKVGFFISGLVILTILIASYFIKIEIDSGQNYILQTPFLGVIIFHNPFILALYILITIIIFFKSLEIKR